MAEVFTSGLQAELCWLAACTSVLSLRTDRRLGEGAAALGTAAEMNSVCVVTLGSGRVPHAEPERALLTFCLKVIRDLRQLRYP